MANGIKVQGIDNQGVVAEGKNKGTDTLIQVNESIIEGNCTLILVNGDRKQDFGDWFKVFEAEEQDFDDSGQDNEILLEEDVTLLEENDA